MTQDKLLTIFKNTFELIDDDEAFSILSRSLDIGERSFKDAIRELDINKMKVLLEDNKTLTKKTLNRAVECNDLRIINFLLVNELTDCDNVVSCACRHNNVDVIEFLGDKVNYGANVFASAGFNSIDSKILKYFLEKAKVGLWLESTVRALNCNNMKGADIIYDHAVECNPKFFEDYDMAKINARDREILDQYIAIK